MEDKYFHAFLKYLFFEMLSKILVDLNTCFSIFFSNQTEIELLG